MKLHRSDLVPILDSDGRITLAWCGNSKKEKQAFRALENLLLKEDKKK